MSDSCVVSGTFPSLKAARSMRERLSRTGFARNSVDIERAGEDFRVSIHTREDNRDRADRILSGSPLADDLRYASAQTFDTLKDNRLLTLGLAAVAGFLLFAVVNRS